MNFKVFFLPFGRLNRLRYFLYGVGVGILFLIIELTLTYIFAEKSILLGIEIVTIPDNIKIIISILECIFQIIGLMLTIQRLHDLDKSGWNLLILFIGGFISAFIPPLFWILVIISGFFLYFMPGTNGPNQFGPDPLINNL